MSRRLLGLFAAFALMGAVSGCATCCGECQESTTQPSSAAAAHDHKDGECCGSGGVCCK